MHFFAGRILKVVAGFALTLGASLIAAHPVVADEVDEMEKVLAPKAGDIAPGFKLSVLGEDEVVSLDDFEGIQDVVLVFGSYT